MYGSFSIAAIKMNISKPGSSTVMVCWCLFQEAAAQPTGHPLKGVPIAVAEEDGSESEEDELKPRGLSKLLTKYAELAHFNDQ